MGVWKRSKREAKADSEPRRAARASATSSLSVCSCSVLSAPDNQAPAWAGISIRRLSLSPPNTNLQTGRLVCFSLLGLPIIRRLSENDSYTRHQYVIRCRAICRAAGAQDLSAPAFGVVFPQTKAPYLGSFQG